MAMISSYFKSFVKQISLGCHNAMSFDGNKEGHGKGDNQIKCTSADNP
jgi:hypothetical protein